MLDKNSNYRGPSIVVEDSNTDRSESSIDTRDFASMSLDELEKLHETVEAVLVRKIAAEMVVLERYLHRLGSAADIVQPRSQKPSKAAGAGRRPYPPVLPKYRNPTRPSETWAGRGRQPQWLTVQLESGKRIEDFRIDSAAA